MLATAVARTTRRRSPLVAAGVGDDDAKFASGTKAPPRNLPPPVELRLVEVSRPGRGDVRQGASPMSKMLAGGAVNVAFSGKATTTAKFSAPGEYVLHVTANDYSGEGGGGEVCCWTTAMVKVVVTQ